MNLSAATIKYIGKPFSEYGCIDFIAKFMADIGKPLPGEVDGIDSINYKHLVDADIKRAQFVMLRTFRKIGTPASTKHPATGDLLVVLQPGGVLFPAVSVGSGQAIASFIRTGVSVFSLNIKNRPVMARRIG